IQCFQGGSGACCGSCFGCGQRGLMPRRQGFPIPPFSPNGVVYMALLVFSYSHADEELRNALEKHLIPLKRMGKIDTWHDRCIVPGEEFEGKIDTNFARADIILLLISSDFIASNYCYEIEMANALERHGRGEAIVIPVILRPCAWH